MTRRTNLGRLQLEGHDYATTKVRIQIIIELNKEIKTLLSWNLRLRSNQQSNLYWNSTMKVQKHSCL